MSLQVSYKKQFVFLFLLTLTFLIVVEVFVNIWLYNFYRCDFEDNELFKDVDPEINRKICIDSLGFVYAEVYLEMEKGTVPGRQDPSQTISHINSEGFRGPEFTKDKPENTYRIFVLGGSAAFGSGVLDNQTFPFYLQQMYDETQVDFKVEVINAGWPGWWSPLEKKLVKNKLIDFDPDLLIVYDGWNDLRRQILFDDLMASPTQWKERWMEICELGKRYDYDTIITIQPSLGTVKKTLSVQEHQNRIKIDEWGLMPYYPDYVKQLDELKKHCTLTSDLRGIFDNFPGPLFFDVAHVPPIGNQIIAEKIYQLSLPIVTSKEQNINFYLENHESNFKEKNIGPISNEFNIIVETYQVLSEIISPYKTPKVFPLIFKQ